MGMLYSPVRTVKFPTGEFCWYTPITEPLAFVETQGADVIKSWKPLKQKVELPPLRLKLPKAMRAALAPGGQVFVSATNKGELTFGDLAAEKTVPGKDKHDGQVRALAFRPDGKRVASGGADKSIKLWDPASGECLNTFLGHTDTFRFAGIWQKVSRTHTWLSGDSGRDRLAREHTQRETGILGRCRKIDDFQPDPYLFPGKIFHSHQENHPMARQVKFKDTMYDLVGPQLKAGDAAPDFECVSGLDIVKLANTSGKARMFSVVPSLDTPVCSQQTKKFDESVAALKDKAVCYTVSLDMPFAQKRFCSAENIANMQNLSDLRNQSFGKNYGVLIQGLPIPLLSRAIFVVDKNNKITYVEYVPEVGQHPNYEKAMEALKATAG